MRSKIMSAVFFLFVSLFVTPQLFSAEADAEKTGKTEPEKEDKADLKGGYFEVGGMIVAPFAGDEIATGDPGFGFSQLDIDPGWGFQVSTGYGFGLVSVGPKFTYARMAENPTGMSTGGMLANADTNADLFVIDLETRIFPLAPTGFFLQPYVLAAIGGGVFDSDFDQSAAVWTMNFGVGVQFLITKHFYLGLEGSYRPVFGADPCGYSYNSFALPTFSCDDDEDVHLATGSANVGFHF